MNLLRISLCALMCIFAGPCHCQSITEYPLVSTSQAGNVCIQSSTGPLWFTDQPGNAIGKMDSSGLISEYILPTANAGIVGCAFGADGRVYFAEQTAKKAGAFNPATLVFQEWPVPAPNAGMAGVVFDASGRLNIMVTGTNNGIQILVPGTGTFTFVTLVSGRYPHGPSQCGGNVWFAEHNANRVARLTPVGVVTEWVLPQSSSQPFGTTCGGDGVYFAEYNVNKVGRISMSTGVITQWDIPSSGSNPMGIATGLDGNIYFAESTTDILAELPIGGGTITEYPVPTPNALPNKVSPCFTADVCFSERGAPQIGVLH